jgi:N-acetyl-anhydromuramyl-L-alanine amidase AmpD
MHRAWHAGVSSWQGRSNLNDWSVGIELVNWNNGEDPFPEAQHQANADLTAHLCRKYNIQPEFILAHYDVSPGRKTDPKGYDMNRLRREVAARL